MCLSASPVSRVIPSTGTSDVANPAEKKDTTKLLVRQSTDYGSSSLPAKDIVGIMIGVAVLIIIFVWMFEVRVRNNAQRVKETRCTSRTTKYQYISRVIRYKHDNPVYCRICLAQGVNDIAVYLETRAWTSGGLSDALTERQTRLLDEAHNIRDALSIMEQQMPEASLLNDENTVGALQSRVSEMMGRMALLEAQIDSDWARGLTNEPPPEYDEAGDNSITHNNRR
ncbi:hypothetical protein C8R41DRAFT_862761 [Lentinula lateritia]|uniref:Uncharacterized protein n=1 Tax=Lentinula lateritia TaxID=40482 RepID=A0ABQ8VXP3_9AGAR|nr:hypothetical protein C8R41DRAFT_862761 [Lentinula lateritia]